jgi:hypothetical protein
VTTLNSQWTRVYAFLLAVMVPMDWFAPTGMLFREFGSKPGTLLLTLGGICGLLVVMRNRASINRLEFTVLVVFAAWLALGFCAALVNFMLGWSDWSYFRDPVIQLITQSLVVLTCAIAVFGNARLMRAYPIVELVVKFLPLAVVLHLCVFFLEAAGVLPDSAGPMLLFRTDEGAIERPTGVFSEPSYFGTFAALYGTALLFIPGRFGTRLFYFMLAVLLYGCAIGIGAKTFLMVAGAQAALMIFNLKKSASNVGIAVTVFAAVIGCGIYFVQSLSLLNVDENLSSAMRLGSTLLAANVATDGYALSGIGTGQFHFFYRDQFAPNFLRLSYEALVQFSPDAPLRASTFNFFVRVLLETGVIGFSLLAICLWKLWRTKLPPSMSWLSMIFAGSLGFLMTQDTWFYPPLVFSCAAMLAILGRDRSREERGPVLPTAAATG